MRKIQGFCWHIQPIFGYQLPLVHLEQALESGRGEADESKRVKSFFCEVHVCCVLELFASPWITGGRVATDTRLLLALLPSIYSFLTNEYQCLRCYFMDTY